MASTRLCTTGPNRMALWIVRILGAHHVHAEAPPDELTGDVDDGRPDRQGSTRLPLDGADETAVEKVDFVDSGSRLAHVSETTRRTGEA